MFYLNLNSKFYYSNVEDFLEKNIIDYRAIKNNVILINTKCLTSEIEIFQKINFDFQIFDLKNDTISEVTEIIGKMNIRSLLLKNIFEKDFENFLRLIYSKEDTILEKIGSIRIIDSDKKVFPTRIEDMIIHLKNHHKWIVFDNYIKINPYYVLDYPKQFNILNDKLDKSQKIILNLIPIKLKQKTYNQYKSILNLQRNLCLV